MPKCMCIKSNYYVFVALCVKVDERKLTEQIQALKKEKNDVMEKMSELQKQVRNEI